MRHRDGFHPAFGIGKTVEFALDDQQVLAFGNLVQPLEILRRTMASERLVLKCSHFCRVMFARLIAIGKAYGVRFAPEIPEPHAGGEHSFTARYLSRNITMHLKV